MNSFKKVLSIILSMIILLSVMPVVSFSAATVLTLNEEIELQITDSEEQVYTYKCGETGYYRLVSWGEEDPYVYCMNSAEEILAESDDVAFSNYNFNCVVRLIKNRNYTFNVGAYSDISETSMYFEKLDIDNATVLSLDENYEANLEGLSTKPSLFKFVPETEGYYGFYSVDGIDPFAYLYDSEMNIIGTADDVSESYDFYLDAYLYAGETYYYEASTFYRSNYDCYEVGIEKTEVIEEIEITKLPDDISVNAEYITETIKFSGLELKFTYSDGSVVEWSYDYDPVPEKSNLNFYWFYDDEDNPYVEIYTTFAYDFYYLETYENNIHSISLESDSEIVLYEGIDSYYDDYLEADVYSYSIPFDTEITIHYNDGTFETIPFYEGNFEYYDTQETEPWTLGENYVFITYFDYETSIPVIVKENNVESVTIDNAPTALYAIGDPIYGFFDYEDYYCLYPYNLKDIALTVKFKDGTEKTYYESDIDYDTLTVDGLPFYIEPIDCTMAGIYTTTIDVMGFTVEYDVKVIDEILLGDVDGDGSVTIMDSSELQRYSAKLSNLTDEQIYIGDADKDNVISVMDCTRIQRYIAKLISEDDFFYVFV